MLGISTYGIREIAKNKSDKTKLNQTFYDLISINILMSILLCFILFISLNYSETLSQNKQLVYIGICKLLLNTFLVEWFYKGIENFKYITIRSFIVKCLYVIAIFVLVKEQKDYYIYYAITVGMVVVNAFCNIFYLRNFISLKLIHFNLSHYFKPLCIFGTYSILTSMYTSFNTTFLGLVTSPTEVGYYTTATKLYSILIGIFTAFTGVMLPRMSSLIVDNNEAEFNRLLSKSYEALWAFSFPIALIGVLCAPDIIMIISGVGYEGAIIPMRIVMPLILIIGYEQIIIMQILMPLKKDKAILTNSILGASVSLLLNICLVKHLQSVGSAIVWVCSEFTVLLMAQYYVKKYKGITFPFFQFTRYLICTLPGILIYIIGIYIMSDTSIILRCSIISILIILYCIIAYSVVMKNSLIKQALNKVNILQ
jgi:flippase wzx